MGIDKKIEGCTKEQLWTLLTCFTSYKQAVEDTFKMNKECYETSISSCEEKIELIKKEIAKREDIKNDN